MKKAMWNHMNQSWVHLKDSLMRMDCTASTIFLLNFQEVAWVTNHKSYLLFLIILLHMILLVMRIMLQINFKFGMLGQFMQILGLSIVCLSCVTLFKNKELVKFCNSCCLGKSCRLYVPFSTTKYANAFEIYGDHHPHPRVIVTLII